MWCKTATISKLLRRFFGYLFCFLAIHIGLVAHTAWAFTAVSLLASQLACLSLAELSKTAETLEIMRVSQTHEDRQKVINGCTIHSKALLSFSVYLFNGPQTHKRGVFGQPKTMVAERCHTPPSPPVTNYLLVYAVPISAIGGAAYLHTKFVHQRKHYYQLVILDFIFS